MSTTRPPDEGGTTQMVAGASGRSTLLTGIVVSEGIAIGTAFVLAERLRVPRHEIKDTDVKLDLIKFDAALAASRDQLVTLKAKSSENEQTARILESQLLMLVDPLFVGEVIQKVKAERHNVESVVADVVEDLSASFAGLEDPYMRDRALDIRDVGTRILRNLMGKHFPSLDRLPDGTILVCHEISPSDMAHLDRTKVLGIASEAGGVTSHAAILARSLGIPALVGVAHATQAVVTGDRVVLDCIQGRVRVNPSQEEVLDYGQLGRQLVVTRERLLASSSLESVTTDGTPLVFRANITVPAEADTIATFGAVGVGLFRTEYLYVHANRLPTEEEQFAAYRRVVECNRGAVTTFRTVDLGGDRKAPYLGVVQEPNPHLGWRSIRLCLDHPEMFKTHLRAIMRASAYGPCRVLYPMISSVEEVRAANAILRAVAVELDRDKIARDPAMKVGAMIEVPAAAVMARELAREVSFFSIGTNDLIQFTMAVDRGNERLASAFTTMGPALLRLVDLVVAAGRDAGIDVACCGEVASSPDGFYLLVGLGIREFSMNVFTIPQMKEIARHLSASEAERVARDAMTRATTDEVRSLVSTRMTAILERVDGARGR